MLKIETTNSPKIIKLVSTKPLVKGSYEFSREEEPPVNSPLAQKFLSLPFIEKVYATANFIALQRTDEVEWELVQEELLDLANAYLEHSPLIQEKPKSLPFSVYVEMTPNPQVMKFVANRILVQGTREATSKDDCDGFPIAEFLFTKPFVKQVFVQENYISITKDDSVEWSEVQNELRMEITEYLKAGGEVATKVDEVLNEASEQIAVRELTDIEQKIQQLLEEYVNPAVASDGGKIELVSYDSDTKTAKMLLRGACSGCPSSTMTLKSGIEGLLKQFLPEDIAAVEAVNA